jgi:hypothetical protein
MSIATNNEGNTLIPVRHNMTDEMFATLASSNKFLPRIQLFGSSSKLCKQGKFPIGHYGLVTAKDTAEDMGVSFDALVINVRPKAVDFNGEQPISIFDNLDPEFARIREDSGESDSNCMWGPEFLLWLPRFGRRYATFFFANPTMRREAPAVRQLMGNAATFKIRFIESKQYGGWHGPIVTACSTPFEPPDFEEIEATLNTFLNPSPSEAKELAEVESQERAR